MIELRPDANPPHPPTLSYAGSRTASNGSKRAKWPWGFYAPGVFLLIYSLLAGLRRAAEMASLFDGARRLYDILWFPLLVVCCGTFIASLISHAVVLPTVKDEIGRGGIRRLLFFLVFPAMSIAMLLAITFDPLKVFRH